jgi:N-formylglutamate deformylase
LSTDDGNVGELHLGSVPLIVSLPHVGTELPADIAAQLTSVGRSLVDTDWHVHHLYAFARDAGVSWLRARYSRYVIDVNRPPDDQSLYPGQTTSQLCPTASFAGEPLYGGELPSAAQISKRRERYWMPYHTTLQGLIASTRARFGYALLLDAHSIRSELPRLFPGRLPDVNVGTHGGRSCAAGFAGGVTAVLEQQTRFTHVLNGRFKGGYITRAYGDPVAGVHAIQLELAQAAYMDEASTAYSAEHAQDLQSLLRQLVASMLAFKPQVSFA